MQPFARGSSEVDWCESNYQTSPLVAEFYNTVSNALFFVMPPLLIYLFRPYTSRIGCGANVVWLLLVVVGCGSVYFHSTLSLVGQLVDEIAIIWVLVAALAFWCPQHLMPRCFNGNRSTFQVALLLLTVVSSAAACVVPKLNNVILMVFGVAAAILLIKEIKRSGESRVRRLGFRSAVMFVAALTCWVTDRVFCSASSSAVALLHSFWHVLVFLSAYTACVLLAYFTARLEHAELLPQIRYWPSDRFEHGVPYVLLLKPRKQSVVC